MSLEYLAAITVIINALVTGSIGFFTYKLTARRTDVEERNTNSETRKTDLDSVRAAMELVGLDVQEQLDLKKKVKHLTDILENSKYQVDVHNIIVFTLGDDAPIIESAKIEELTVRRITSKPQAVLPVGK